MTKTVYGLLDEDTLNVFYVGCTNNVERRRREHNTNPFNTAHPEYNTYKYQYCRQLKQQGRRYRLHILTDSADITDRSDEYAWILKFADHNREAGIEYYDGYPLTNMKAGDFLEEMLREPTVRTADQIRQYRQTRAQQIQALRQQINYNRNTSGNQAFGDGRRKHVADSMVLVTESRRTQQTLEALEQRRRQQQRERREELNREVWRLREQHWLETGEMWGIDYDRQDTK
jgi:predicted GIY-YIG superfamily endonuclease